MTGTAMRRSRAFALALALLTSVGGLTVASTPAAADVPPAFTDTLVDNGLTAPTAMAFAPDGRIFVAEQAGRLRVIENGTLLATPFLTVTVSSAGERGLLGVTFDPDFATNQFVYVYYTATTPTVHNRLSRFTANGNVAVPGSEQILLELNNLSSATNHNGGAIHFGPDGKLYVAVGENANGANAQSLNNVLGKILRLNADGTIPQDNPFIASTTGRNQAIWALGLRNPFTFTFQPGTGRMFVNDVGQNAWEEINDGVAGANYGWPATEGRTTDPRFRSPVFAYPHSTPGVCAITGGAFYNPTTPTFPAEFVGTYFYADFCAGFIRRIDPDTGADTGFATDLDSPVDLAVGADGDLYYLARGSGSVRRIGHPAAEPPLITISGFAYQGALTVPPGATVTVRNADAAPHTLTAVDGSFTTPIIEPVASATFVAPLTAGSHPITCDLHPTMTGVLVVAGDTPAPPSESPPAPPGAGFNDAHMH